MLHWNSNQCPANRTILLAENAQPSACNMIPEPTTTTNHFVRLDKTLAMTKQGYRQLLPDTHGAVVPLIDQLSSPLEVELSVFVN